MKKITITLRSPINPTSLEPKYEIYCNKYSIVKILDNFIKVVEEDGIEYLIPISNISVIEEMEK